MGAPKKVKWPACGCQTVCQRQVCRDASKDKSYANRPGGPGLTNIPRDNIKAAHQDLVGRKYKEADFKRVLAAAEKFPNMAVICQETGINRSNINYWLELSREGQPGDRYDIHLESGQVLRFHIAFAEALDAGNDEIERKLRESATGQLKVALTHQGRQTYRLDPYLLWLGYPVHEAYMLDKNGDFVPETVQQFDGENARWLLARNRPEKYGNRMQVQHTHKGGVVVLSAPMTSEQLENKFGGEQDIVDVEFEALPAPRSTP